MAVTNGLRKRLAHDAHPISPLEESGSDDALDHVHGQNGHGQKQRSGKEGANAVFSPSPSPPPLPRRGEAPSASGSESRSESETESDSEEEDEEGGPSSPTPTASSRPLPPEDSAPTPSVGKGWYEFDLSVVVALISPLGNWLTGGDHVKNLLLILLLIFYLHQIIEVPWSLYHASRPRRRHPDRPLPEDASTEDRYRHFASSELRSLELFYLLLTVLSPLGGALLLRSVVVNLAGTQSISWFSTSLFVLATGMRPWRHAVDRLRQRTSDLHDVVHNPSVPDEDLRAQLEALAARVAALESQLEINRRAQAGLADDMYAHLDDTLAVVERGARKQERRLDTVRIAHETRFAKLESGIEELLEHKEVSANGHLPRVIVAPGVLAESSLLVTLREQLAPILPAWVDGALGGGKKESPRTSPRSPRSPKTLRTRSLPTLETIPEREVFRGKADGHDKSNGGGKAKAAARWVVLIPGLGLVLRIGDLATLPIRAVVHFLLSGRIWSPA